MAQYTIDDEKTRKLQQQQQTGTAVDNNTPAGKYNYDAGANQGYQNANTALQQAQANRPSVSYDASSDENYQKAQSALQQAQANKPSASYDPISDTAYQQALAALNQAQSNMPNYAGTFDSQLTDLYNQIVNRDKFSYDLNADMLYQQYRDQYMHMGRQAMMDTMGQAAALTGGYGNSYAQNVGQQTYNNYLNQLNDVIPELYNAAQNRYNAEGEAMLNQYAMLGDLRDTEYGQYQDSMNNYWQNVGYLAGRADTAYNRGLADWQNQYNDYWQNVDFLNNQANIAYNQGLANWQNQYNDYWQNMEYLSNRADTEYSKGYEDWYNSLKMETDAANTAWEKEKYEDETAYNRAQDAWEKEKYESETAYDRQQDAYSNLVTAIASTGYTPTAEELTAAGMSQAEAEAWLNYFNLQNGTSYSYGSSGGSGGSGYYSGSGSSSGGSSSGSSGSGTSSSSGNTIPTMASDKYVDDLVNNVLSEASKPTSGVYGSTIGGTPGIQGVDYDYLASQGNKNNTSSGASKTNTSNKTSNSSSSSSSNKQTQAGSSNASSSNKGTTLSDSKMASTISAYKNQIKSSYGSNLTTAQMNAYLKNKILYSSYSSAQKTQLLKYAGLV